MSNVAAGDVTSVCRCQILTTSAHPYKFAPFSIFLLSDYLLGITHTVRSQILLLSSIGLSYLIGVCLLRPTGILNLGGGGGGGAFTNDED